MGCVCDWCKVTSSNKCLWISSGNAFLSNKASEHFGILFWSSPLFSRWNWTCSARLFSMRLVWPRASNLAEQCSRSRLMGFVLISRGRLWWAIIESAMIAATATSKNWWGRTIVFSTHGSLWTWQCWDGVFAKWCQFDSNRIATSSYVLQKDALGQTSRTRVERSRCTWSIPIHHLFRKNGVQWRRREDS